MDTKRFAAVLLLLSMVAINPSQAQTVGLIQATQDGLLLTVDRPITKGVVNFQYRSRYDAKSDKQDMQVHCCLKLPTADFRLLTKELPNITYKYREKLPKEMDSDFTGAAILVSERVAVSQVKQDTIQTNGLKVKTCWSSEGFHVIGYVGKKQVADLYQGFDYTIESPTCKEEK